jgi:hypothetical protein
VVRKEVLVLAKRGCPRAPLLPGQGYQNHRRLGQTCHLRYTINMGSFVPIGNGERSPTTPFNMYRIFVHNFCSTFYLLPSILVRNFPFRFRLAAHLILVVINPRETRYDRFACLGKVRSRLGLLPRLLERGEFYSISQLTRKGVITYLPWSVRGDPLARTRSECNPPYVVLGYR